MILITYTETEKVALFQYSILYVSVETSVASSVHILCLHTLFLYLVWTLPVVDLGSCKARISILLLELFCILDLCCILQLVRIMVFYFIVVFYVFLSLYFCVCMCLCVCVHVCVLGGLGPYTATFSDPLYLLIN